MGCAALRHGLGAKLAPFGGEGYLGEALGADPGGWRLGFFDPRHQKIHWHDDQEVDHGGLNKKVDDSGEKTAIADLAAVQGEKKIGEVGFTCDGSDERADDVVGECCDDLAEGSTDDDGDCEIDDVAAQNEVAKSLEHGRLLG